VIARNGGGEEPERNLDEGYRTLVEQIPAIVYVWAVADGLDQVAEEYVSPQIEPVLGFRPEEWVENPRLWIDRLHPDDREEVLDETKRSVEAGEPFKLEYRMVARNGRVVWLHDVASVLTRDASGRATRYQGVQLDITARKDAEHSQRRAWERLAVAHREQRALLKRLVNAQDDERQRISEGIHDDTMQGMYSVGVGLDAFLREHRSVPGIEALSGLRIQITRLTDRLRHLAFDLHPRILDAEGLRAAFHSLIERSDSEWARIEHRFEDRSKEEPSSETALNLYRIAQEALSNAHRHAQASAVTIAIEDRTGGMLLRIHDDGSGFDVDTTPAAHEHLGLRTMRERAEISGGWLVIESSPGVGTTVECWLPRATSEVEQGARPDPSLPVGRGAEAEASEGPLALLSDREREVAELLSLGHTNAEIGAIMHLSTRTIEHHRSRVFRKLGVRSRAGVVQVLRGRASNGRGRAPG
jgi:PAS domain S-box-containing protein